MSVKRYYAVYLFSLAYTYYSSYLYPLYTDTPQPSCHALYCRFQGLMPALECDIREGLEVALVLAPYEECIEQLAEDGMVH
jgi:hypothetical protein